MTDETAPDEQVNGQWRGIVRVCANIIADGDDTDRRMALNIISRIQKLLDKRRVKRPYAKKLAA